MESSLLRRNPVLRELLCAAPLIMLTETVQQAGMLCAAFSISALLTVLLCALIPRRFLFAVRVVLYSVIAALVYVPSVLAAEYLLPDAGSSIYLALLAEGLLLSAAFDSMMEKQSLHKMLREIFMLLVSVNVTILLFGMMRELLGCGTLAGRICLRHAPLPLLGTPAGGMLLLALFCILSQVICGADRREERRDAASE